MTLPEGKIGKLLALGICALILLTVQALAVRPLLSLYGGMQSEISDLDLQRIRLTRLEAELPKLKARILELKRRAKSDSPLLSESSDSVAAASLQTRLQTLAKSKGAEISSVESLPPKTQEGFRRIGVRVVLRSDLAGLAEILHALATSRPVLFVDNLEIRNNASVFSLGGNAPPALNIGLDIYGYRIDNLKTAEAR